MALPWYADDDAFRAELERGHRWAEQVAKRLRASGRTVEVTPMGWRKTLADRHDFADEVDLTVEHPRHGTLLVEVKSRAVTFGADPRHYPYSTALLERVDVWHAKTRPRAAYVIVSQLTGAMLAVSVTRTQHLWTVKHCQNRPRGIEVDCYEVPRAELRPIGDLVAYLAKQ